jgi:hypothetical protein
VADFQNVPHDHKGKAEIYLNAYIDIYSSHPTKPGQIKFSNLFSLFCVRIVHFKKLNIPML